MKNTVKWIGIIGGGLVVLIIVILLVVPMFVDVNKYKPILEDKVAEATGRSFAVGDDIRLSLFPWATIAFSDLHLGNTPGFAEKDFVSLKSFEIRLKLLPLLFRDIQIKRFVLNEPRIVLIKNKNGDTNWSQPKPSAENRSADAQKTPTDEKNGGLGLPVDTLEIGEFAIKNGSLAWIDHAAGDRKVVSDLNLTLKNISFEQAVQMKLSVKVDGKPITIEGNVGPVGNNFSRESIPLDLTVKALSQINLSLKGLLERPTDNPGVNVNVSLAEFSPRKLLSELGHAQTVVTADPAVLKKMALKANIIADAKQLAFKDATLNLDDSQLKFGVRVAEFSRPVVRADLQLDRIDIDRYLPPAAEKKEGAPEGEKKDPGTKKTDYEPLRKLDLEAKFTAGSVIVSKARIQDLALQATAKNGIIRLKPFGFTMYQGSVSGSGIMNVKKSVPRFSADVDVAHLLIGPLLRDQLDKDLLEGVAAAKLNLSFRGDQAPIIKKTLNGKGQVRLNDGAVIGIDLAGMVRNAKAAFRGTPAGEQRPRTDFTEMRSLFTLKNGVYHTADTNLMSPFLRVLVTGQADLVKEILDFRVEPKVVGSTKGQGDTKQRSGVLIPVNVSGSFSSPNYEPDLKAMAAQQLEERVFESDKAKELFEKEELKPYEGAAKGLLKGLLD